MNKKILLLSLTVFSLAACSKTKLLYTENAYNSPVFDENYYLDRDDIDDLQLEETTAGLFINFSSEDGLNNLNANGFNPNNYSWIDNEQDKMFGYHYNLDNIEPKFNYGILSKLYDGRVRCDGYYQKSRVQLNKTGYATYFPKSLQSAEYLAFACRGGTTLKNPLGFSANKIEEGQQGYERRALSIDFTLSFYIHLVNSDKYKKVTYTLEDVNVQCDNGGGTNLVFLRIVPDQLAGAVAMSLEWQCNDPRLEEHNLTDDCTNKEKEHLALMLYEVFIGESTWF